MINSFEQRHIGTSVSGKQEMLNTVGVKSLDQLINETVPKDIRLKLPLNVSDGMSESEYLEHIANYLRKIKCLIVLLDKVIITRLHLHLSYVIFSRTRVGILHTPPIRLKFHRVI